MSPLHSHPCGLCGRRPAEGFASIGDHWYCHPDNGPSCYVQMQHLLAFGDRSWDGLTDAEAAAEDATWK
jgi:hypothetical protein